MKNLCVYYRWRLPDNPYESEEVLLSDLPARRDALRALVLENFYLDYDGRVALREKEELHEMFRPMCMAEYCLWNTLNVGALFSGGVFFFYADETGVLLRSQDRILRLQVVNAIGRTRETIDCSGVSVGRMPGGGSATFFHVFPADFQPPSIVEVFEDLSIPVQAWVAESLRITEEYVAAVRCASELVTESDRGYRSLFKTMKLCDECEEHLPTAYATLDAMQER